jgi:DNA-binding response OmpR family regulator
VLELDGDLPDLILLDLHMPDIDGRDVCKQLKARARTRRIPVIMVSANKDTPAIATDAGAEAFVLKPFEMSHVLAIVEEHIGKSSP